MKNLKKACSILLVCCFMLALSTVTFAAQPSEVKVKLDGEYITFDTKPCIIGGRTMVPLRAIFEALGATVNWDDATQTVTSYNEAYLVKCTISKNEMSVNNVIKIMDVPPMIVDGRTLVPARFIAEAFACKVEWDADNRTVIITSTAIDYSKLEQATENTPVQPNPSVPTYQPNPTVSSKGTIQNPYSAQDGATIVYQEWSHYPQKQVAIKCTNVIRGTTANTLAYSENMFNDQPNSAQEWCFLEFDVKYISASGSGEELLEGSDVIYEDTFFDANGAKLNVADMATLGDIYEGYGVFDTEFYPGSSGKVVIGILINKNVGDILLRVPNKTGGTNTFIKCTDGNISSNPAGSNVSTNNNETTPTPSVPTYQPNTTVGSKGTIQNPYSAKDGATIVYQEWSHYPQKQVAIRCTNVIRGTTANTLAYSENMFNDQPNSAQEWCFLEFDVKYISASGSGEELLEGSDVIYKDTFFDANGAKLNVADMATLGDIYEGYGVFDTEFYPGGSGKVVIGILINKNVGDILLRVPNKTGGTNTFINCTYGNN